LRDLFAGIDCSTQSCKLVIIDAEKTEVVFSAQINYDDDLPHYHTLNGIEKSTEVGQSESDPFMWIEAIEKLFSQLKKQDFPINEIKAISVSGQQHGLVCLDKQGNLSRAKSKLWNDFSTQEECDLLTQAMGGQAHMINEVGNSQRTGYTASKIYHFARHEPQAFNKTATVFLVHNFINWYLTGGKNGGVRVMEPGDTSGMALWHPGKRTWSEKLVKFISPQLAEKLPPVLPSDKFIGTIGKELVELFGFHERCRIDAGSGDNMYGAVGTGNVVAGIITVSLGTSGTAYSYLDQPFIDPEGEIAAFCDSTGHFLPLLCVSNLANGYNALLKKFNISHLEFNEIVKKVEPGCHGRLVIPWFTGERTPDLPLAAPCYFGFQIDDFNKSCLCRAVLEGHILNLHHGFKKLPVKAKEIRLTGGLSQSEVWCQTIADIFETDVVPVAGEGAALGAALHAYWVYEKENREEVSLEKIVRPFVNLVEKKRKTPRLEYQKQYRILTKLFDTLSKTLRGKKAEHNPFKLRHELIH